MAILVNGGRRTGEDYIPDCRQIANRLLGTGQLVRFIGASDSNQASGSGFRAPALWFSLTGDRSMKHGPLPHGGGP